MSQGGDEMGLNLGDYSSELAAAIAHDLAARILADDDLNFTTEEFARLLPAFADLVIAGLSPTVPKNLRREMIDFAREARRKQARGQPGRSGGVVRLEDLGRKGRRHRP